MRYLFVSILALALSSTAASAGHGKWFVGFGFGFSNHGGDCSPLRSSFSDCGFGYGGYSSLYPSSYPYRFYAPYSRIYGEANYSPPRPFVAPVGCSDYNYYNYTARPFVAPPVGSYNPPPRMFCPPTTYDRAYYPPSTYGPVGGGSTFLQPSTYNVMRGSGMGRR